MVEISHPSNTARKNSVKRQKIDSSLYAKSSFDHFNRPSYGRIAYSSNDFNLKPNEEIENDFVSRNRISVIEEPLLSVEDISHEWPDISNNELNDQETTSNEDKTEETQFDFGASSVNHPPESINNPKEATDEHCKMAEDVENYPWIFSETFNQTQLSHSSTEVDLLKNLERPFLLPLKSFSSKPIDFKKLNIANEFWTQTKLPLNVTNPSRNSFVVDRRFHQTKQCKLSKSTFDNIFVINQVDRKFICCIVAENKKRLLLLVDQHAAHERVCLEKLIRSNLSYV